MICLALSPSTGTRWQVHASLCDQLVDLVQNSLEAGASQVTLRWAEDDETIAVEIEDNGKGMTPEIQASALNPFYTNGEKHRHRKVGLGLAFLKQTVDAAEGDMRLVSQPGAGTTVCFRVKAKHVDLPPKGSWVDALTGVMGMTGEFELIAERSVNGQAYRVTRQELLEVLGDLETASSLALARDYIASQEEALLTGRGK